MKWPLFENKIKDELSGHRSEVDIDALWSAIEPEVNAINQSKRKKRFGIIWFLFAAILLIGGAAGYYFLNNGSTVEEKNIAETISDAKAYKQAEDNANSRRHEIGTNKSTRNNSVSKLNKELILDKQTELESKTSNAKSIEKHTLKNNQQANTDSNTSKNSSNKEKNTQDIITNKNAKTEISNTLTLSKNTVINISENESDEIPGFIFQIESLAIPSIPLYKTLIKPPQLQIPFLKNVLADNLPTPGPSGKKQHPGNINAIRLSIGVNTGITYANRKLTARDTTETILLHLRKKTEKRLETSHLGLRLNIRLRSGFDFTTGFQYTRMVERFDYNENITKVDSVGGILYYAVNPNNDTLAVMGTVPHTIITDIEKEYYNRYTMFDIPVLIGYFREKNDWSMGAQAGIFSNISLKTEGRFLKNETQDEDINGLFKSSVGLSYYFGFSAGYKLGDNMEIGVSPYFRYFPKNFAKDSYSLSQKYKMFGINANFKYWF